MANASDTFTDTNGTSLESHTADTGETWTKRDAVAPELTITNNVCHATLNSSQADYYMSWTPDSADYNVSADFQAGSTETTPTVTGRNATGARTMYGFRFNSSNGWILYKWVSGSRTTLGNYVGDTPTSAKNGKLIMVGSSISVQVDGVERIAVTDTAITSAGKAGASNFFADASTARWIDNFLAANPSAAAATMSSQSRQGRKTGIGRRR